MLDDSTGSDRESTSDLGDRRKGANSRSGHRSGRSAQNWTKGSGCDKKNPA